MNTYDMCEELSETLTEDDILLVGSSCMAVRIFGKHYHGKAPMMQSCAAQGAMGASIPVSIGIALASGKHDEMDGIIAELKFNMSAKDAELDELRLALKVAIVCNAEQKSWGVESPFQKRLDDLVGKFEHEKVNRDDIAEGYCSYCETPLADVAAAREHGKICEKHPLRIELAAKDAALEAQQKIVFEMERQDLRNEQELVMLRECLIKLSAHPAPQEHIGDADDMPPLVNFLLHPKAGDE